MQIKTWNPSVKEWLHVVHDVVGIVIASSGVLLFDAVEASVPTYMVTVIAGATDLA